MKMIKRIAAFLSAFVLILTCIPATNVHAETYYYYIDLNATSDTNISATIGEPVTLSVDVQTDCDPNDITYTWYLCENDPDWVYQFTTNRKKVYEATGAEGQTYTVPEFNYACYYYCIATATVSKGDSPWDDVGFNIFYDNQFTSVNDNGQAEEWPSFDKICNFGEQVTLSAQIKGTNLKNVTYRWYKNDDEYPTNTTTSPTFTTDPIKGPTQYTLKATDQYGNIMYNDFFISTNDLISYDYSKTVSVKPGHDAVIDVTPFISGKKLDTSGFTYYWYYYNGEATSDDCESIDGIDNSCTLKNVTKDMTILCEIYYPGGYKDLYIDIKVDDSTEEQATSKPTPIQKPVSTTPTVTKLSNIQISGISNKIAAGKRIRLKATVIPATATNKTIIWTSSNPKVATVDQTGLVKMNKKSAGKSVLITATATDGSNIKATYKIKSSKGVVKKINVTGAKTVKAGKKLKLKAKVFATKGANKKVIWTSSNTKFATVTANGKVKTLKAGKGKKVKITAMATDGSNKKKTVTIKLK